MATSASGGTGRTYSAELIRFMAASTPVGDDQLDGVGGHLGGHRQRLPLVPARTLQHVVGAGLAAGRLADPDPHPQVVAGVEVGVDGLEPVVPGRAPAGLHLDPSRGEVELVVDHDQPLATVAAAPRRRRRGPSMPARRTSGATARPDSFM